jgi:hypothetical protein
MSGSHYEAQTEHLSTQVAARLLEMGVRTSLGHGKLYAVHIVFCTGTDLCDGSIPSSGESNRLCVCVSLSVTKYNNEILYSYKGGGGTNST